MSAQPTGTITRCLVAVGRGDRQAREQLWSLAYAELRDLAGALMAQEAVGHTLQPTALVNEAFVRLLGGENLSQPNRAYFFAAAARAMRRILIEHARRRSRADTDGGVTTMTAEYVTMPATAPFDDLLTLDQALDNLEADDDYSFQVVMLRFWAGLTIKDTAAVLGTSPETVKRRWRYAKAWLARRMEQATV